MTEPTITPPTQTVRRVPLAAVIVLIAVVYACSIYANLSFALRNSADYRFFPPFKTHVDGNKNRELAAENFNIARSLVEGQSFANPFNAQSGPTAWMPPVLPGVLAGLYWACDGDRDRVMAVVVFFQVNVLIGTGLLVLLLAQQTTRQVGAGLALTTFLAEVLYYFSWCFQRTQDCWLVLLAVDLLIAWVCLWRPLPCWQAAAAWGLLGGLCALINPIVGFTWGILTLLIGLQNQTWPRFALAVLVAGLTLTPWTVRNYLVFDRLIPIKSNLAYELYQSQSMWPDGLLPASRFKDHPYTLSTREGQEYRSLGEVAFLDRKREQFWQAVWENPTDFVKRVARRFLAATLWHESFAQSERSKQPWVLWIERLIHPLPFLGLLILVFTTRHERLHRAQWTVIGVYLLYLLPYVVISYYERYAVALIGTKVLLVLWGVDRLLVVIRSQKQANRGQRVTLDAPRSEQQVLVTTG